MFKEENIYIRLCYNYKKQVERDGFAFIADERIIAALHSASKWLSGKGKKWLIIKGTFGTGKTTLASAIASTISQLVLLRDAKYMQFLILSQQQLTNMVRQGDDAFDKCSTCKYLILNDIGSDVQYVNTFGTTINPVEQILLERYDKHSPHSTTIITTNLTMDDLCNSYGKERMKDRLMQMCNSIVLTGESYRQKAKDINTEIL